MTSARRPATPCVLAKTASTPESMAALQYVTRRPSVNWWYSSAGTPRNAATPASLNACLMTTGIKFFTWIGTMCKGQLTFETPMLFSVGFLVTFLLGGCPGCCWPAPPIDFHVTDTYFVVPHFHYVLFGTIVFATFAGVYFWFPKMTGRLLDERLGKLHFWLGAGGGPSTIRPLPRVPRGRAVPPVSPPRGCAHNAGTRGPAVRIQTIVRHSYPQSRHVQQNLVLLPGCTLSGVTPSFFLGSNSFARSGNSLTRLFARYLYRASLACCLAHSFWSVTYSARFFAA